MRWTRPRPDTPISPCFPESSILGWENPEAHRWPRPFPAKTATASPRWREKHSIMIAIGLDEKDGDKLYDSAILVDKSGKLLWKHRKINVLPELMTPPYSQGRPEDIGVVETEFGRIAVLICADTFTDALLRPAEGAQAGPDAGAVWLGRAERPMAAALQSCWRHW